MLNYYDLSQYGNLLDFVPNVANLPRNVMISFTGQDTGFKYSTAYNVGRDAFVGLDCSIFNGSGAVATARLDSRDYWILDNNVRTLTDIPFNEVLLGATGATVNAMDLTIFGCSMKYLMNLAKYNSQNRGEELNFGINGGLP